MAPGPAQPEARFVGARGLGHPDSAWLGSTQLGSARIGSAGYSGFGSSRLLAHARLGSPDLGFEIHSKIGSAQLGAWLGLSSCIDSGLATRDSAWLASGLSSAYLDRSLARLISAKIISHFFSERKQYTDETLADKNCQNLTKKVRDKNGQNSKRIDV